MEAKGRAFGRILCRSSRAVVSALENPETDARLFQGLSDEHPEHQDEGRDHAHERLATKKAGRERLATCIDPRPLLWGLVLGPVIYDKTDESPNDNA